jgi:hypothetical protein
MPEPIDMPWLAKAADLASHKLMNAQVLQGFGLLAVAEAIHRLASAVEGQSSRPGA